MAQGSVEAFQHGLAAGNRRDVEALLEVLDPEIEWWPALNLMLGGENAVYRGHEGVREFLRDSNQTWDDFRVEFFEVRDLGERLLARGRMHGRGKTSGAETESPINYLVDFKNGKAIRIRTFVDLNEALEAAGLRE